MKHYPIDQAFFNEATAIVAQKLLGMLLIRTIDTKLLVGKIVETESYTYDDPASHCYGRRTTRTEALFGPTGHTYIYTLYGIHYGFNVVAYNQADKAGGVLIRSVEPLEGIEQMQAFRPNTSLKSLTNGPGKLTQAFNIDLGFYAHNLTQDNELFIAHPQQAESFVVSATRRIGITKAPDDKKRFIIKDNQWVTPHLFNKN
jgi:DNA-3-methyladenine glycosylase